MMASQAISISMTTHFPCIYPLCVALKFDCQLALSSLPMVLALFTPHSSIKGILSSSFDIIKTKLTSAFPRSSTLPRKSNFWQNSSSREITRCSISGFLKIYTNTGFGGTHLQLQCLRDEGKRLRCSRSSSAT